MDRGPSGKKIPQTVVPIRTKQMGAHNDGTQPTEKNLNQERTGGTNLSNQKEKRQAEEPPPDPRSDPSRKEPPPESSKKPAQEVSVDHNLQAEAPSWCHLDNDDDEDCYLDVILGKSIVHSDNCPYSKEFVEYYNNIDVDSAPAKSVNQRFQET